MAEATLWEKICRTREIPANQLKVVGRLNGSVAIYNIDGTFYAIKNECAHRGGPLSEGHKDGMSLVCPWHAWTFDLKTGRCDNAPEAKQKIYRTKIEDDFLFVELE